MPPLKLGVDLACLPLPFKKALHTAAQLGANAVEIDARGEVTPQRLSRTGLRQLRKMLDDLSLRVSAVAFRTRRGYDTPADLDARVAATKAAMQFAHDLGAAVVLNHVGQVPDEADSSAGQLLVEVLHDLGNHGHRVGALLAAETGTESGEDLARLLRRLPDGLLGADLDPGSLLANGHSPLEAIGALGESILHVHATDGLIDLARNRGQQTPLGQGAADYPALLGALDEHAYRGYFTVTCHGVDDPASEIARVMKVLREM